MDSLVWIAAAMSAIVFTWVGYFLGNFLPVFRRKGAPESQYQKGSRQIEIDFEPIKKFFARARDWLLERDEAGGESIEEDASGEEMGAGEEPVQGRGNAQAMDAGSPEVKKEAASPIPRGKGTIHVWQERTSERFFAEVDGLLLDLNQPLSPEHHNKLSFLLVDLQEKVGVSATIQSRISEKLEKALPDEEAEPARPSFNPLKTVVDYVKADVPKLEDKPDSIPLQINAILQDLLEGTPLDEKGISVSEFPERGVVFIVGLQIYDAIEDIPDPDIRIVIRKAVKKWEEEQGED